MAKHHTFGLLVTMKLQFTFTEAEVERGPGDDLLPTDAAAAALAQDLTEVLGDNYIVDEVEVHTEDALLLGINED